GFVLETQKDWALPYYRDRAMALALGASYVELLGSFLARYTQHHSRGRMMPDHFSDKNLNIPPQSSCVGSQYLQAVGVAKAIQLKGEENVVYVSGGDGSTSQGDFHEALNIASLHRLPVIFCIQDNGYAISTPKSEQSGAVSIAKMFSGYEHLESFEINGTSIEQLYAAFTYAKNRATDHLGPTLVVAKVPRMNSHTCSDDQTKYRDAKSIEEARTQDPLIALEKLLVAEGIYSTEQIDAFRKQIKQDVDLATMLAEKIPFPKKETATEILFVESEIIEEKDPTLSNEKITMMDGLNHALKEEMEKDSSIVVFGEDVAKEKGGVFGITRELTARFGYDRCFNTPLAESTIIGMGIGLAVAGYKPVVEIQFADYAFSGINQLLNEMPSVHYRSSGEWNCPMTVRIPYGGYIQGGTYHSQSIEAHLLHTPGVKVVVPSNAMDAKRLLKASIRDPNPVIFLEHKGLYRQASFSSTYEPAESDLLPLGKAKVIHEGEDVTFITYGMLTHMGNDVTLKLAKEGISVELIDLRTLNPLDFETIKKSVMKTGKVLIAHEASKTCGFAAELASLISENIFEYLDASIVRVCGKDFPVPYCLDLEHQILPQKEDLYEALKKLSQY
ncbi:MAG TPA: thiamine pyrophosphate-dependent enzyme, partial [Chlamydiales bacterium]|nr:thiamine pyrophosphate-dependent enzyme [Chlamydiales bacterium]